MLLILVADLKLNGLFSHVKDRERAKQDYMINLKSELEIRLLHEKIDHLIMDQQQELIKLQQIQISKLDLLLNNNVN